MNYPASGHQQDLHFAEWRLRFHRQFLVFRKNALHFPALAYTLAIVRNPRP